MSVTAAGVAHSTLTRRRTALDPRSKPRITRAQIIDWRLEHGESQRAFWARFGVTQSRGSRYETGGEIPVPVSLLLGLYFNEAIGDRELAAATGRIDRAPTVSC